MNEFIYMPIISKLGGLYIILYDDDLSYKVIRIIGDFLQEYAKERIIDKENIEQITQKINDTVFLGSFYPELDVEIIGTVLKQINLADKINKTFNINDLTTARAISSFNSSFLYPGDIIKLFTALRENKITLKAFFLVFLLLLVNNLIFFNEIFFKDYQKEKELRNIKLYILKLLL